MSLLINCSTKHQLLFLLRLFHALDILPMSAVNMMNQIYRVFSLLGNFNKTVTVPIISNTLPQKSASQIVSHGIYPAHWCSPPGNKALVFPSRQLQTELGITIIIVFFANTQVLVVFSSLLIFCSYGLHLLVSSDCLIWQEMQTIPNNGSLKQKFPTFQCSQGRKPLGATNNIFSLLFNIMGPPIS